MLDAECGSVPPKVLGDTKLQAEDSPERTEGKVQNAVGGVKDALKE